MGTDVAITLVLGLLNQANQMGALIMKAQAEKRDITLAELDQLSSDADKALADLGKAIFDARKSQ